MGEMPQGGALVIAKPVAQRGPGNNWFYEKRERKRAGAVCQNVLERLALPGKEGLPSLPVEGEKPWDCRTREQRSRQEKGVMAGGPQGPPAGRKKRHTGTLLFTRGGKRIPGCPQRKKVLFPLGGKGSGAARPLAKEAFFFRREKMHRKRGWPLMSRKGPITLKNPF